MTPVVFIDYASLRLLIVARLYKCGRCTNWHSGSATGFPLTKDGIFATNYHVLEQTDGKTLAVMDTEENVYPVTQVLAADKDSDVAIVRGQRVQNSGHFLWVSLPGSGRMCMLSVTPMECFITTPRAWFRFMIRSKENQTRSGWRSLRIMPEVLVVHLY